MVLLVNQGLSRMKNNYQRFKPSVATLARVVPLIPKFKEAPTSTSQPCPDTQAVAIRLSVHAEKKGG